MTLFMSRSFLFRFDTISGRDLLNITPSPALQEPIAPISTLTGPNPSLKAMFLLLGPQYAIKRQLMKEVLNKLYRSYFISAERKEE